MPPPPALPAASSSSREFQRSEGWVTLGTKDRLTNVVPHEKISLRRANLTHFFFHFVFGLSLSFFIGEENEPKKTERASFYIINKISWADLFVPPRPSDLPASVPSVWCHRAFRDRSGWSRNRSSLSREDRLNNRCTGWGSRGCPGKEKPFLIPNG